MTSNDDAATNSQRVALSRRLSTGAIPLAVLFAAVSDDLARWLIGAATVAVFVGIWYIHRVSQQEHEAVQPSATNGLRARRPRTAVVRLVAVALGWWIATTSGWEPWGFLLAGAFSASEIFLVTRDLRGLPGRWFLPSFPNGQRSAGS